MRDGLKMQRQLVGLVLDLHSTFCRRQSREVFKSEVIRLALCLGNLV